jgi:hypothetical protein
MSTSASTAGTGLLVRDPDLPSQRASVRETDQVTIEEFKDEIALEAKIDPDSGYVTYWERQLSLWDGGSSSCGNGDRPDGATLDSGEAGD